MAKQAGPNVITVDFKTQDVCKFIQGQEPSCLDGESALPAEGLVPDRLQCALTARRSTSRRRFSHKVEKALMLETDVSETPNEMIFLAKKMGRIGLIGVYAGYTNHFNIGALMEGSAVHR